MGYQMTALVIGPSVRSACCSLRISVPFTLSAVFHDAVCGLAMFIFGVCIHTGFRTVIKS